MVTIEPIEVPKTLSDSGYTPGVAGHRLRDALNAYAGAPAPGDDRHPLNSNLNSVAHDDASLNSNLDLSISASHELPDIVVPQIGLSLRAIASSIRSGLGMTGHAISGELTRQDSKYALRVRVDGRQVFSSGYEAENPDDLMTKAAPGVMEIIRPAAHAMARYRDRKKEGLLRAEQIIAHYNKSDINVQWAYLLKGKHALRTRQLSTGRRDVFESSQLEPEQRATAYAIGRIAASQGRPDDAIKQFRTRARDQPEIGDRPQQHRRCAGYAGEPENAGLDPAN